MAHLGSGACIAAADIMMIFAGEGEASNLGIPFAADCCYFSNYFCTGDGPNEKRSGCMGCCDCRRRCDTRYVGFSGGALWQGLPI